MRAIVSNVIESKFLKILILFSILFLTGCVTQTTTPTPTVTPSNNISVVSANISSAHNATAVYVDPIVLQVLNYTGSASVIIELFSNYSGSFDNETIVVENKKKIEQIVSRYFVGYRINRIGVFGDWFSTTIDAKLLRQLQYESNIKAIY
ncbi:hypothetical protein HY993_02060, partial [Candidatus Micrarchaeota archaeon]|nr:hypothetical protein [Candidatus Micrarchaeota archaeon]